MDFQIITNNPLVKKELEKEYEIVYLDISYKEVLETVRDKCHSGYMLLSHPLTGSVKPNETPYKSIMISKGKKGADMESISIIENSIIAYNKFTDLGKKWSQRVLEDFQLIDFSLISSGIESAKIN